MWQTALVFPFITLVPSTPSTSLKKNNNNIKRAHRFCVSSTKYRDWRQKPVQSTNYVTINSSRILIPATSAHTRFLLFSVFCCRRSDSLPLCSSPRQQMNEYRERCVCFSPLSIIPLNLHIHLHPHVTLSRRTNGSSLATFRKTMLFRKCGSMGQKITCI